MNFAVITIIDGVSECVAIIKLRDMAHFYAGYIFDTGYYDKVTVMDVSTGEVLWSIENE